MTITKLKLALGATAIAVVGVVGGVGAGVAYAEPTHMQNALGDLQSAQSQLQQALPDKAGHRVEAIGLIQGAINQVNLGIQAGGGN